MIQIKVENEVVVATYSGDKEMEGFIVVESIIESEPKIGYYPELHYTEEKGLFYEYIESIQPAIEINYDDKVNSLIRLKYSVSNEISILRQKEAKPQEYEQYYNYCEECKLKAKEQLASGLI